MSDVILCGVGGQGTVLASRLIARAAMDAGLPIRTAETIGMAQRGGSVVSHVRVGARGTSPLIGRGGADLIIGFEPAETARQLPYLREGGFVVASDRAIVPASASVGGPAYDLDAVMGYLHNVVGERLRVVDAGAAFAALGSMRVLNVVLLGVASGTGALGIDVEGLRGAVGALVADHLVDLNLRALGLQAKSA